MVEIFDFISLIMADILKALHFIVPNYGWSIVLLTLLIKLVLFPTAISQTRSLEVSKVLQPKLKELHEKYRDHPEELNRRMLELYREYKVNPLSGCLTLLIQIPILFALFALLRSPEKFGLVAKPGGPPFNGETFLGLSLMAKGNPKNIIGSLGNLILAVLAAMTTYLQQKMTTPSAASTDSTTDSMVSMQAAFLYFMPIFFGFITFTMEAAIGIYWVAQSVIGILQQIVITRFFVRPIKPEPEAAAKPKRRKQ
ncbi:MAG: YidC/Oxa1 family membrane protein insertase [Firmicutes bacterium]|nr:YidC/Oxa1 family membrane protein insertase [Bacillota bacterium]